MQQHVEFADGPRGGVVDLAAKPEIGRVPAGLLDELAADDEHAARAARGVIDTHARSGLEDSDHRADDIARGVEVAALFARRLGEHIDEKLVGRAEQVGELEILVAQPVAVEVAHQVLARVVGNHALVALHAHELDMIQNMFEGFVGLAERAERFVENAAVGFGGITEATLQVGPPCPFWHEETVVEVRVLTVLRLRHLLDHPLLDLTADDSLALGVKHVRTALQEQHPEDEVLIGGGIESLLAEAVGRGVEMAFEFSERELGHGVSASCCLWVGQRQYPSGLLYPAIVIMSCGSAQILRGDYHSTDERPTGAGPLEPLVRLLIRFV